jgi:hypothetical protein
VEDLVPGLSILLIRVWFGSFDSSAQEPMAPPCVHVRLYRKDGDAVGTYEQVQSVAALLHNIHVKLGVRGTLTRADGVDLVGDELNLPAGTYIFNPGHGELSDPLPPTVDKREQAARYLEKKLPSPSSYAKPTEGGWADPKNKQLLSALQCHRPANFGGMPPLPVSLLDPILAALRGDAESCCPSRADCAFALRMSEAMSEPYITEEERLVKFWKLFEGEFGVVGQRIEINNARTDGSVIHPRGGMLLNVEGKNEIGSGGRSIHVQNAAYHAAYVVQRSCDRIRGVSVCPSILIELAGPNLSLSGAVFGECAVCDPLTPMISLLWLPHSPLMTRAARCFGALRKALPALECFYNDMASVLIPTRQLDFPYPTSYQTQQGKDVDFVYTERVSTLCFKGYVRDSGEAVFLKFCRQYGADAHMLMAGCGFAPMLKGMASLEGGRLLVVMTFVDLQPWAVTDPAERPASLLTTALQSLHGAGFVHGDIRGGNILVGSGRLFVVDYEWAGVEGQARYPFFMNHVSEEWPVGASDGELIRVEHDDWWMKRLTGV